MFKLSRSTTFRLPNKTSEAKRTKIKIESGGGTAVCIDEEKTKRDGRGR